MQSPLVANWKGQCLSFWEEEPPIRMKVCYKYFITCPIEIVIFRLLNDDNSIVELLPLKNWMHVMQKNFKVVFSVSKSEIKD